MSETTYAPGTPCWVDLTTPDLSATIRFYEGLFGWTHETADQEQYGGYTTFSKDGKPVAAASPPMPGGESQPAAWTTYFATDNIDGSVKLVEDAGGTTLLEPMDVPPHGHMAIFSDPAGAVFALWQASEMKGAQLTGEPGSLTWNELITLDVEGAKSFYEAVFHFTPDTQQYGPGEYTMFNLDDKPVAGAMAMGPEFPAEVPPHWKIYFAVDDCDAAVAKATELGGQVDAPSVDTPAGRMASLRDPHGAAFAVIKTQS
jgi:predicted enzyme related to lactoylglutathione lyase